MPSVSVMKRRLLLTTWEVSLPLKLRQMKMLRRRGLQEITAPLEVIPLPPPKCQSQRPHQPPLQRQPAPKYAQGVENPNNLTLIITHTGVRLWGVTPLSLNPVCKHVHLSRKDPYTHLTCLLRQRCLLLPLNNQLCH
jgi:hypothetical protein